MMCCARPREELLSRKECQKEDCCEQQPKCLHRGEHAVASEYSIPALLLALRARDRFPIDLKRGVPSGLLRGCFGAVVCCMLAGSRSWARGIGGMQRSVIIGALRWIRKHGICLIDRLHERAGLRTRILVRVPLLRECLVGGADDLRRRVPCYTQYIVVGCCLHWLPMDGDSRAVQEGDDVRFQAGAVPQLPPKLPLPHVSRLAVRSLGRSFDR